MVRRLKRPDRDILTSKIPQFGVISGASPDLARLNKYKAYVKSYAYVSQWQRN